MGLSPVGWNASWAEGGRLHSCWMLRNGMAHDETPGTPGYTVEGDLAGNNGNVAASSGVSAPNGNFVELWMTGPFHAIGLMRPGLRTIGAGRCDTDVSLGTNWRSSATLDVLRGVDWSVPVTTPITFPGNGSVLRNTRFVAETPDPRSFCGWGTKTVGVPLVAMLPESAGGARTSLTGPNGPVETCTLTNSNTTGTAQAILGPNTVVAVPADPFTAGTYTATVVTGRRTATWSFTVHPTGGGDPVTEPIGAPLGFAPTGPTRVVDSRSTQGLTRLRAGVPQRLQLTGTAQIPAGAGAAALNVTIVEPGVGGYATVYPCGPVPNVSTVNFPAGGAVANATIVPLDPGGGVCVMSIADTHIVIDVTGHFADGARERFNPAGPLRVLDTRSGFGGSLRIPAGGVVAIPIAGVGTVPGGASAAAVNLVGVNPATAGYLTAFPCGTSRPTTSSLNYLGGPGARANNQLVALGGGRLCIFSSAAADVVVDVTGYFAATGRSFQALKPVRVLDTRLAHHTMSAGTVGAFVATGATVQVPLAGRYNIPAGAVAVAANVVAVRPVAAGFLTTYPSFTSRSETSSVNFTANSIVANGAQVPLGGGSANVYTSASAHVIMDITGAWV
jgi:hypothetical protein